MSDIYSLGCIFLDIITFMIKGRTTDFVKFRTVKTSNARGKMKLDNSFHVDPDKIDEWLTILREESSKQSGDIYRGVPELLKLFRRMLAQNGTLRPTALEVRDRVQEILVGECGVETLCCAGREWAVDDIKPLNVRDSISVATGLTTASRNGSESARGGEGMVGLARTDTGVRSERRRSSAASNKPSKLLAWRENYVNVPVMY